MSKLTKAEKFFKNQKDMGVEPWLAWEQLLVKFPQCKRVFADVEPKPVPVEYLDSFEKYYDQSLHMGWDGR